MNSGPCWLVWLPSPCVKQLCLPETRYHTRGDGSTHSSLGWKPKPSGCVYDCQHLREVILALGETGADWVPSMKLLQGGEGFEPCSVLLGVTTASLFMGLSVAGRITATSRYTLVKLALCFHTSSTPALPSPPFRAGLPAQAASKDMCLKEGVNDLSSA